MNAQPCRALVHEGNTVRAAPERLTQPMDDFSICAAGVIAEFPATPAPDKTRVVMVAGAQEAGRYEVAVDGTGLSSGACIHRLTIGHNRRPTHGS
jgi:hypothetical protein